MKKTNTLLIALASMALLQAFLHREPASRTVRLLGGAVAIIVIGCIAEIPLGVDVALMGLVMVVVVTVDVIVRDVPAQESVRG